MNTRFLLILWCLAVSARAELIPAINIAPWTPGVTVGVQGGIKTNRAPVVIVTGIDPSGNSDSQPAIQAALNAAPDNSVVMLPEGTYLCNNPINLKAKVTLRGAGMDKTTIKAGSGVGGSIFMGRQKSSNHYYDMSGAPLVTGNKAKGTTTLTVTGGTDEFQVGMQCQITRKINSTATEGQFDIPVVFHPQQQTGGFAWPWKQKAMVTAKTATTVTIVPGIIGHNWNDYDVRIAPGLTVVPSGWIGLEDFHIDMSPNDGVAKAIMLEEQDNSWVLRVKVSLANNYSLDLMDCMFTEVRECYFGALDHGGTNGAGILLGGCTGALIENNIILNSFPTIEVNSSVGNVIAYNFMLNAPPLADYFSMNSNHSAHPSHNLFEGNETSNLINDGFHGSGSTDTVFRNWFHRLYHWYALALKRFTREYMVVGNIFGRIGGEFENKDNGIQRLGEPNIGNSNTNGGIAPPWPQWGTPAGQSGFQELDKGVGETTVFKHNFYFFGGKVPTAERVQDPLPDSLYLSGKPAWFGNLKFPPFDPYDPDITWDQNAPGEDWQKWKESLKKIPAGYRYVMGTNPDGGGPTPTPTPGPSATPTPGPTPPPPTISFALQWNAVPTAIKYFVYENNTKIAEQTTLTYSLTGKVGPKSYTVSAVNAAGESPKSNTVSLPAPTPTPTPAPTATPTPTPRPPAAPVLQIIQQ